MLRLREAFALPRGGETEMKRKWIVWTIVAGLALSAAAGLALHSGMAQEELELGVICTPSAQGSMIVAVLSGGAAQRAGLRPGDILSQIDGVACEGSDCPRRVSADTSFTIERDGITMTRSCR